MDTTILLWIGAILITVIGYFLKQTMEELKLFKTMSIETKTKLSLLELDHSNKYNHLNEKIDALSDSIKDLINEIKDLNRKIK
jgi:hypothetical protein